MRDFTQTDRRLDIVVDASPVYETLLGLFVYGEGRDSEYADVDFFDRVDARLDPELRAEIVGAGSCWSVWLSLVAMASDLTEARSVKAFTAMLRTTEPREVRHQMLACCGPPELKNADAETMTSVLEGDTSSLEEHLPEKYEGLQHVLSMKPARSIEWIANIIERFYEDVMVHELEGSLPLLEREAAAQRAVAHTMPPDRFVEAATHGITFELQPNVSGILLIPSVVIRPWTVFTENDTVRVFCYSLSDEQLTADPSAPPSYLVEIYKALGDGRRLKLLGLLAESDADLKTLADRVDVGKSTVHHHLRILRRAGLVRVVIGPDEHLYSLRKEGLSEAGPLLEGFLAARRGTSNEPTDLDRKD
ncbi:MAG: ArsR family transcriptional regulator [Acidimicrobiia bacterium]